MLQSQHTLYGYSGPKSTNSNLQIKVEKSSINIGLRLFMVIVFSVYVTTGSSTSWLARLIFQATSPVKFRGGSGKVGLENVVPTHRTTQFKFIIARSIVHNHDNNTLAWPMNLQTSKANCYMPHSMKSIVMEARRWKESLAKDLQKWVRLIEADSFKWKEAYSCIVIPQGHGHGQKRLEGYSTQLLFTMLFGAKNIVFGGVFVGVICLHYRCCEWVNLICVMHQNG